MLSKKAKYAIKALVALTRHGNEQPYLRIAEISERENIPKKFLETILLDLRKHGVLGSKLGVNGGYYLQKKAKDISLTEIIRLTDGPIALVPCVSLTFYKQCDDCEDEVTCGIRKVMTELRIASLGVLSNRSIQDIVQHEKRLINKLK